MSTIAVRRSDVTGHDVAETLRAALGEGYTVLPAMRTVRRPLARPRPAPDDTVFVGRGSGRLFCAQVTIVRHPAGTDLRISPGGLGWETLVNSLGISRRIARALTARWDAGATTAPR